MARNTARFEDLHASHFSCEFTLMDTFRWRHVTGKSTIRKKGRDYTSCAATESTVHSPTSEAYTSEPALIDPCPAPDRGNPSPRCRSPAGTNRGLPTGSTGDDAPAARTAEEASAIPSPSAFCVHFVVIFGTVAAMYLVSFRALDLMHCMPVLCTHSRILPFRNCMIDVRA